jgi:hypothetical protein
MVDIDLSCFHGTGMPPEEPNQTGIHVSAVKAL